PGRERGRLVAARVRRRQRQRVVLLPPDRPPPLHRHLRGQDARDRALERGRRLHALRFGDEGEVAARGIAQEGGGEDDGVVVEGGRVVVAALQRPHLWPAAVGHLRGEEIVEPAQEGGAEARVGRGAVGQRQKAHLRRRRVVV